MTLADLATTAVNNIWHMLAILSGLGYMICLLRLGKHGGLASVTSVMNVPT